MDAADRFSANRESMIRSQIMRRGINNEKVLRAFRKIPRHLFVPNESVDAAYDDHPIPIGLGQTISQPYIVALMTDHLCLSGKEKVLEIGTGSGYQTAILSQLAGEVYSVELIEVLSKKARSTIETLNIKNVHFFVGDGSVGLKDHAPFDRIIFTAAVPDIADEIRDQLNDNGIMVVPIGQRWHQVLEIWTREGDQFIKEKILPVVFVPLRGKYGWQD